MILVTGGTGLVGSHLMVSLAKQGKKIRALRRPDSRLDAVCRVFRWEADEGDALFRQIEWVEGDVCDPSSLDQAMKGIDIVYHCAAVVSFRKTDYELIGSVNIKGTANVVDACLLNGVKRLCHVSSIAALGKAEDGTPVDELTPWNAGVRHSPYGLSKFAAEREVWRGIEEGLEAVIVNPSIILGPSEPQKAGCRLFTAIKKGLPFYPPGANGFVDVRDVVKIMLLLVEKGAFNERFLVNGENLSYFALFSRMSATLGQRPPYIPVPAFALKLIWRFNSLLSWVLRVNPDLTRETARSAYIKSSYDNSKIINRLNYSFLKVEDTMENLIRFCGAYRTDLFKNCDE